jgi:hypothetical protein
MRKTNLHLSSVYTLLSEYTSAEQIANAHLTSLKNLLCGASKGRCGSDDTLKIRDAAQNAPPSVLKLSGVLKFPIRTYFQTHIIKQIFYALYTP